MCLLLIFALQLRFRGYLQEKFNWGYHYYFLADEGVEYLRDYLHLDETAFPDTPVARTAKDTEEEAEKPERSGRRWADRE